MKPTGEYLPSSDPVAQQVALVFQIYILQTALNAPTLNSLGHESHILAGPLNEQVDSKLQTRAGGDNSTCQKSRAWLTSLSGLFEIISSHARYFVGDVWWERANSMDDVTDARTGVPAPIGPLSHLDKDPNSSQKFFVEHLLRA
jgi:hypothetical protein